MSKTDFDISWIGGVLWDSGGGVRHRIVIMVDKKRQISRMLWKVILLILSLFKGLFGAILDKMSSF